MLKVKSGIALMYIIEIYVIDMVVPKPSGKGCGCIHGLSGQIESNYGLTTFILQ